MHHHLSLTSVGIAAGGEWLMITAAAAAAAE